MSEYLATPPPKAGFGDGDWVARAEKTCETLEQVATEDGTMGEANDLMSELGDSMRRDVADVQDAGDNVDNDRERLSRLRESMGAAYGALRALLEGPGK